uniref:Putative secreted protein n=1 Tax=Anopheles triannulatus TaxID=58253 RepID=A0A2M4B318_9DIPT
MCATQILSTGLAVCMRALSSSYQSHHGATCVCVFVRDRLCDECALCARVRMCPAFQVCVVRVSFVCLFR